MSGDIEQASDQTASRYAAPAQVKTNNG